MSIIIKDGRVFGLFPEFRGYLKKDAVAQAATDLRTITADVVREMIDRVPNEWDVKREARNALVDLVVGRAMFVAETIETRLWPQGSLFPDDDEEGNPER